MMKAVLEAGIGVVVDLDLVQNLGRAQVVEVEAKMRKGVSPTKMEKVVFTKKSNLFPVLVKLYNNKIYF